MQLPVSTSIKVKLTPVEGFHYYPNAPDEVAFLQQPHRHLFTAKVTIEVRHSDRELEFFMVKRQLDKLFQELVPSQDSPQPYSCEFLAKQLLGKVVKLYGPRKVTVEVSEDNENSAIVTFLP